MFRVLYRDFTVEEVPEAVSGSVRDLELICYNAARRPVRTFCAWEILMYGNGPTMDALTAGFLSASRATLATGRFGNVPADRVI